MHRWSVGEVEIVRIEDDDFTLPSETTVPEWAVEAGLAPSPTETALAFTSYGIRSGGTRIVVDPWIANDHPRTSDAAAGHSSRLIDELGAAGFPPEEVDVVVLSHFDGQGWMTRPDGDGGWTVTFANARHLIDREELAAVRRGEALFDPASAAEMVEAITPEPIDPPLTLTEEVTLVPAPGHNYGHVAVRIDSAGEVAVIPGHLFLTVFEVDDPALVQGDAGDPIAEPTRRALLDDLADRGGVLHLPLVGGPAGGAGVVERDGAGFRLVSPRPRTP